MGAAKAPLAGSLPRSWPQCSSVLAACTLARPSCGCLGVLTKGPGWPWVCCECGCSGSGEVMLGSPVLLTQSCLLLPPSHYCTVQTPKCGHCSAMRHPLRGPTSAHPPAPAWTPQCTVQRWKAQNEAVGRDRGQWPRNRGDCPTGSKSWALSPDGDFAGGVCPSMLSILSPSYSGCHRPNGDSCSQGADGW